MADSILNKQYLHEYIAVIAVSVLFAILCMFMGTLSPMIVILEEEGYHDIPPISKTVSSWTINSVNIGVFCSAMITAYTSDIIGKKRSLFLAQVPQILSHILMYFAQNAYMIYASTVLRGICLGMGYGLIPNYISEVTSPKLRGPSTVFVMLLIPISSLIAGMIQAVASISDTTIIMAVLTVCAMPLLFVMPESPYYYVAKNRNDECKQTLRVLRHTENVDKEFLEIQTTWINNEKTKNVSWIQLFRSRLNRRVFFICAGVQIVQQVTGYIPLYAYSHDIVFNSGLNLSLLTITIMLNAITIFFNVISIFIIEKIGRRILFISACIMVIIGLGLIGTGFYLQDEQTSKWFGILITSGILIYLSAFGFSLAFFHNLLASELFPSDFKSRGVSIIVMLQSIEGTVLTLAYDALYSIVDYLPFMILFILTVFGLIFGYLVVPETKNKSLAEIQNDLNLKTKQGERMIFIDERKGGQ